MAVRQYLRTHTNPPVFVISGVIAIGFVLWGVLAPANLAAVAAVVSSFITMNFEWLYILAATAFLIFVVVIMLSRFGRVRLGPSDSKPEYGNLAWFSMLFTAGMGIGLVFYAVSEPVWHFANPPIGEGLNPQAAQNAMNFTFFHWGFHPWAIYIVVGLSLGYFTFRRGLPLRPAAAFYPLIGNRIYGWVGNLIDILAVFGTLFGLATTLGIGGTQVGAGLNTLFGLDNTATLQVIIILVITSVAVVSVMAGIDKGIRRLSLANLWLAFALMVLVFVFAPTRTLLNSVATDVGSYLQNLPLLSFETFSGNQGAQEWQNTWTLFYWGWWISWSPFVGMFIARISFGRTVRSFIGGALFAPVGASFVWLAVFGETAFSMLRNTGAQDNAIMQAAENNPENAMYALFEQLPIGGVVATVFSIIAVVVVVLFFATSSDSGSLVVDILTNGGDPHPRWQQRLFWAIMEGVIAAVLLVAGAAIGDSEQALSALQTASIAAGLPFCIVLIFMCVGVAKGLAQERVGPTRPPDPPPLAGMRYAAQRPSEKSEGAAAQPDTPDTQADYRSE